jgi:DNA-binding transcriptional LysR family regulator
MASSGLDWQLCRSFLAVIQTGSLSRAGRMLGLTQPTVGRHIQELEAAVATPLFVRSPRGLVPTDAGLGLRPHAEAMAAAAGAFLRAASARANEVQGTVRITAGDMTGTEVLPPILAAFREVHPAVAVELVLSDRTEDLLRREADIAVRMVRPTQTALVVRRVGVVDGGLHAARSYLDRYGTPTTREALARHALIGFDSEALIARLRRDTGAPVSRGALAFRCDSGPAQLAAMRAGYGIGGCQYGIARRYPELVPLLAGDIRLRLETWVAMHEDARAVPCIRLMYRHLVTALAAYVGESAAPSPVVRRKALILQGE